MLAIATSLRTNSTTASTPAPKPCGALPSRWRRCTWRPAYQMVRNTSSAATIMNTTCLVGETSMPSRRQPVGRCHSPSPNGSSITWLSDVCSKIALPMSGPCVSARISSPVPFPSVVPYAVIDVHEPAEPAHPRAHQREQRPRPQPAIHHPAERAEREDGEREAEAQRDVGIAFAEAPAEAIALVVWHGAAGNIRPCEKFRKQSYKRATLCGA